MNAASASLVNSTIVRSESTRGTLVRAYFGIVSRVLPNVARRQAERLFTAPPRCAGRKPLDGEGHSERVVSGPHSLAVWQSGARDAPGVLLVHGWGGRGAQMRSFVAPLVASGYRVVWFDQPSHGDSGDGAVALPDFVRALHSLSAAYGPFNAAIGHSLGAAALGVALRAGLPLERVVFVSSPSSISEHAHKFARMLGITPAIREAMRRRLERRYGMPFDEIDRIDELARLRLPALFVHDGDDTEVPLENSLRLAARMPGSRLIRTYGLGHHRILRDRAVIDAIGSFIGGDVARLPSELPPLPRPAPLY